MKSKSQQNSWIGRHTGKDELRQDIWSRLAENNYSIGSAYGHIPNFQGSEEAADIFQALPIWKHAAVIKCNPDTAQLPVRIRAIEDGKLLYMAVPRLSEEKCFIKFTKSDLEKSTPLHEALSAKNATSLGTLVTFEEMQKIDLVVTGCVAVSRDGGRTGKGAGFADLEMGMLREFGLINQRTPIITTVHPGQIVEPNLVPMQAHDSALNWIITPNEVIETKTSHKQPPGIDWAIVRDDQYSSIPILKELQERYQEK